MNLPYFLPHDSTLFNSSVRPFDYDPAAICPKWMSFLNFTTCGDSEVARTLQQWFASVLLPDIRHEKFLWLKGLGSDGKSVLTTVLSYTIGEHIVSNLSVRHLTGKHELAGLADAKLNIAMEFGKFTPALIDAVKNLSSNEPVLINEKNKLVYSARLGVRLLFVSNKVPHISDYSDGFWRRCLLVYCVACIRGRENLALIDELKTESAGIFNWLLEGAVDLVRNKGHIDVAPPIHQAVARQRRVMDPHKVFLEEELIEAGLDQWIPSVLSLYPYYQRWMADRGHDGVLSWPNLKLRLEEIYPRVADEQKRHPINQGRTRRGIAGIFWRDEAEAKARYLDDIANEAIKKAYAKALKDLKIDTQAGRQRFREKFQRENQIWMRSQKKKEINPSSPPVTERRAEEVPRNEIDELLKQFEDDDKC